MKKLILSLVVFFMVAVVTVTAQDFNLSSQSVIRSKYVGPDGLVFYDNPVVQSSVTLNHKSGLYFDLWLSSGLNTDWSSDWDDEIDYTLGWSGKVSPYNLNASISYFDNFKVWNGPYNDVIKSTIKLDLPKQVNSWLKVVPFLNYTNFSIPDKKTPFNGGNLYSLGIDNEVVITEKIKVTPLVQLSYDDGAFEVKPGCFLKLSSNVNLTLSKHFVWNVVEVTFYDPLGKREMKDELILGSGLSWTL